MSAARARWRWPPKRAIACLLAAWFTLPATAHADEAAAPAAKLTLGDYHYSGGYDGQDLNLRWHRDDSNWWLAAYRDREFGSQARTGFDSDIALGPNITLQPSLQLAQRGFVGGSLNLQIGDPWFALVGLGRTNLKPYFNLNFDPNDALTLGLGWHGAQGQTVSLTRIADDRLGTGQTDWHLIARWPLAGDLRATLDLLRKSGEGDAGAVRAWGWSATLDFPTWFVRLARDPQQNFSAQDATRIAAGVRF